MTRGLDDLARLTGSPARGFDDEHVRWELYQRAAQSPGGLELLREVLAGETDQILAAAVVLWALELVPGTEHPLWIARLAPDNRAYSEQRADEIAILRSARDLTAEQLCQDLDEWTDWLQRRLPEHLDDPATLDVLARHARTKRVRNAAAQRLRELAGVVRKSGRSGNPGERGTPGSS